jgi:mevalonate kinase
MTSSAPAKIILFGEHAVVYGHPAIAVPLSSLRAQAVIHPLEQGAGLHIEAIDLNEVLPVAVDAEMVDNALALTAQKVLKALSLSPPDALIRVSSSIPMASGLGSGAAVSTAVARAVLEATNTPISVDHLNTIIYEIEKVYHGTPSGIDNTVVVHEKPVYFVRGKPLQMLDIGAELMFVIGDTGVASPTKVAVGDVRTLVEREPEQIHPILTHIGTITDSAREAIRTGDVTTLGRLMTQNHEALQRLTVSSEALDKLVKAAMDAGAIGAKLSGGGRGGNMIALTTPDHADAIRIALIHAGAVHTYLTELKP